MKKIRFTAVAETYNDETRYRIVDHWGSPWVYHRPFQRYDAWKGLEIGDDLEAWRERTCESPEMALITHAPLTSTDFTMIPPDTKLTRICVETLSSEGKGVVPFYAYAEFVKHAFKLNPMPGEFFTFTTIDDVTHLFLYSDIKHISFEEF